MLSNYILIALRTMRKNKVFAAINIFGLAVGLACCVLILLHVYDELQFDLFHQKADRIYRVNAVVKNPNGENTFGYVMPPLAGALEREIPEVEHSTNLVLASRSTVKRELGTPTGLIARDYFFADQSVFSVFDFQLISGDLNSALKRPGSVVLTETMAKKLFSESDPIGKALIFEIEDAPEFGTIPYTVEGVMRDIPGNSHLQFSFLVSKSTLHQFEETRSQQQSWDSFFAATYVVLRDEREGSALPGKLAAIVSKYLPPADAAITRFDLQPLRAIHFGSSAIGWEHNSHEGEIIYVNILALIALFIAGIACINYMNLATARAMRRAREIGLRKVVGAARGQMVGQFLTESILSTAIAFVISIGLVEAILPWFNMLAGTYLSLGAALSPVPILSSLALVLILGLIAGSYPAFYLSSLKPASILRGESKGGGYRSRVRSTLVVLQFVVSIVMIAATIVVFRQLDHVRNKNLGINQERLIVFDINSDAIQENFLTVKRELQTHSVLNKVTVSSRVPGDWKGFRRTRFSAEGRSDQEAVSCYVNAVDEDFLSTYEIALLQGRNFSRSLTTDSSAVILNETAAKTLFSDSPIGQVLRAENFTGHVVGVVRDFHFHSLHTKIAPLVLALIPPGGRHALHGIDYFTLRVPSGGTEEAVKAATAVHAKFDPINPIELGFLDEWWNNLYDEDDRLGRIFGVGAFMAILIACVGLFALAAFIAEQRTKEIGVRKVLGASVGGIVSLLSRDFAKLVLVGTIVASPLSYYAMDSWLAGFAYRISVEWWVFIVSGGLALIIALLTVGFQAAKAALANPAEALRYE